MSWEPSFVSIESEQWVAEVRYYINKWHWEVQKLGKGVDCGYEETRKDAEAMAIRLLPESERNKKWESQRESSEWLGCRLTTAKVANGWGWAAYYGTETVASGNAPTLARARKRAEKAAWKRDEDTDP